MCVDGLEIWNRGGRIVDKVKSDCFWGSGRGWGRGCGFLLYVFGLIIFCFFF